MLSPSPELLANENVPPSLVRLLRDRGLVVHAVSDLMPAASDRAVLHHAHQEGLWILTFDRDYGELVFARKAPAPPAIIYLRQGPQAMTAFAQTVATLLAHDAASLLGHLVVVNGRSVRRRALPAELLAPPL